LRNGEEAGNARLRAAFPTLISKEEGILQPFDYVAPLDLREASTLLSSPEGRAWALQGGTDLLVRIRAGVVQPGLVVDLKKLPGMQAIREWPDGWLSIGAACTMNQVANESLVRERYDLLAQACNSVASYQLRNRATVGGNCCNGSPAADTAPALYCLGAEAEIFGPSGQRRVPIDRFFTGPGRTALGPGEFMSAILLPPVGPGAQGVFNKLGRTRAGDISAVSVAVYAFEDGDAGSRKSATPYCWRIALGAVGPTPMRAPRAEESLTKDRSSSGIATAAELAGQAAQPIDDVRASAAYRRAMVQVLTGRGIEAVLQKMEGIV
jgi:carbon-monoxide dehydrogenase medium subunit